MISRVLCYKVPGFCTGEETQRERERETQNSDSGSGQFFFYVSDDGGGFLSWLGLGKPAHQISFGKWTGGVNVFAAINGN